MKSNTLQLKGLPNVIHGKNSFHYITLFLKMQARMKTAATIEKIVFDFKRLIPIVVKERSTSSFLN